jgi:hypothetical protein
MLVPAAVMFSLGLLNLVINTTSLGSWLPLLVLMPLPFLQGLRQLRAQRASDRRS